MEFKKLINKKLKNEDIKEIIIDLPYNLNKYDGLNYMNTVERRTLIANKNFNVIITATEYIFKSIVRYGRCINFNIIDRKTNKNILGDDSK